LSSNSVAQYETLKVLEVVPALASLPTNSILRFVILLNDQKLRGWRVKVITLVRHAKSSWKNSNLSDLERPLKKRGRRDAPMMGRRLAKQNLSVELIISSPAVRAVETAELIADELGYAHSGIKICDGIYDADADDLLDIIRGLDSEFDQVMLVGHNPESTDLANRLAPLEIENLPTCGVVVLYYNVGSWAQVGMVQAARYTLDYPKRKKTG
jgi:phosphohistidine phosphatase